MIFCSHFNSRSFPVVHDAVEVVGEIKVGTAEPGEALVGSGRVIDPGTPVTYVVIGCSQPLISKSEIRINHPIIGSNDIL